MPYALLDRWGIVRCYVSPAPDVVLESYLNREISLRGTSEKLADGTMHLRGAMPAAKTEAAKVAPRATAGEPKLAPVVAARPMPAEEFKPEPAAPREARNSVVRGARSAPRTVAYQEEIPRPTPEESIIPVPADPGVVAGPSPEIYEGGIASGADCGVPAGDCGPSCEPCEADCDPCEVGSCLSGLWVRADYLMWWTQGMYLPALVTTGPSPDQPGFLGSAGTEILYGNERVGERVRSGGRLQAGTWLNCCRTVGLEGEYLGLEDAATHFRLWSDGNPIVSRPFFDTLQEQENIQKVAFPRGSPGSLDGSISVDTYSQFQSAGARLRLNMCRAEYSWQDSCDPCNTYQGSYRSHLLLGYRFLRLDDSLRIREELTSTEPDALGAFVVQDEFETKNQFNGGELGMLFEFRRGRWSVDLTPKIAFGTTHQTADVRGSTRTTEADGSQRTESGGLLALSSNIGRYSNDTFSVVPELGTTLGYQLTNHTRLTFGYTFLYWSRVARAGEQIDRSVNPSLLPSGGPVEGDPTHPAFSFQQSSFWAQGMNFGVDVRF